MCQIAAIQMVSSTEVEINLRDAADLITQAANAGARLIVLPENFSFMGKHLHDNLAVSEPFGQGAIQTFLSEQAAQHHVWLVGGTISLQTEVADKVSATCLVFDNNGQYVARYDKIHLFDATVAVGEQYCESQTIRAGQQITVVATPFGKLGIGVCYDIRFPELFRCYLHQGIELIALPAAFTATTGKVHWELLVRARAVENLAYVIAANQGGNHANGRETYGDSMIVDPWGKVLQRLPTGKGIVCAEMNREQLVTLRQHFPCIQHRKIACHF